MRVKTPCHGPVTTGTGVAVTTSPGSGAKSPQTPWVVATRIWLPSGSGASAQIESPPEPLLTVPISFQCSLLPSASANRPHTLRAPQGAQTAYMSCPLAFA